MSKYLIRSVKNVHSKQSLDLQTKREAKIIERKEKQEALNDSKVKKSRIGVAEEII